jgi:acetyltransferase
MPISSPAFSQSDLSVFFRPSGVAVIGASRDPQKLGHGVVRNLQSVKYDGPIYPVNPKEDEILGLKVYRATSEVPDPVDLAVIAVPAKYVPEELKACGKRGIKGAIIISGGFRETGAAGLALEDELKKISAEYGIRIIGPNCIGTIDAHTPLNSTFVVGMPRPGDIAFLSQSGAMAAAVMDWAVGSGVGFSRIVSLGNQTDVASTEMLSQIGRDGKTKVITGYLESIDNGRAFVEAATDVAKELPVVILKAGRGASGSKAAMSHTGAMAGDLEAYKAAFRRSGVLWANTMEELFDWGRALAWQPLPKGNRVAILTNAGGPAILAADALEELGMTLAPLTADTKAFLRRRVFAAASVENPVDILAGAGPATYALCLDALLTDETVDAVIVVQAPQDWFEPLSLAEVIGEVANSSLGRQKPILSVIMGLASTSEATQILHRRHIPNYAFPERVGTTLGAMWQRKKWLDEVKEQEHSLWDTNLVLPNSDFLLTPGWQAPADSELLLNCHQIETPKGGFASTQAEAIEIAERIGYPVVMKLVAEGITHKTDVGGVALNLANSKDIEREFDLMCSRSAAHSVRMLGVSVQQMVKGSAELIVGIVRDPQFGPLVMVGLGGTAVELNKDVAFELAPVTPKIAGDMLDRTAAGKLIAGYRGAHPADRQAAIDAIVKLSRLVIEHPEIAEIEINPLIVLPEGHGAVAVDARVRVTEPKAVAEMA